MAPTIMSGSSIIVGATRATDLKQTDIALFAAGDSLYAHRFMGWSADPNGQPALEFCGDASLESDPLVAPEAVIGVVVKVEAPKRFGMRHRWAMAARLRTPVLATRVARAGYRALSLALAKQQWLQHLQSDPFDT